jgi:2-C-methyl-D-erythritol 4-phosphate cytidylyltransferase
MPTEQLPKAFAIVPAAGMGKRMGANINKQYLMLGGKPIVAHTLQRFQDSPLISGIILVTPLDEIPFCRAEVVEKYKLDKVIEITPGGAERQNSVQNGLDALGRIAAENDVVLIHDGVRPFITEEIIRRSIIAAAEYDGALVAVKAKDTIKVVTGDLVKSTPDRDTLWQAQTPQAFRFGLISAAYKKAASDAFLGTDDCSLVERNNGAIRIVSGDYRNIKITTPEDLILAEAFLAQTA